MLGAGLVLLAVAWWFLQGRVLAVPPYFGFGGVTLWSSLLPWVWSVAIADAFASKSQAVEVRAVARTRVLDVGLFATAVVGAAAVGMILGGPWEPPVLTAAHVALMTGVACSVTLLSGPGPAGLVTSSLVILTTTYGMSLPLARYVRVLQPDGDVAFVALAATLSCAVAVWLIATGRTVIRLGSTVRVSD